MACHAPAWAAVGAEKAPVNQARVAGEKPSRARCALLGMRPSCTSALTTGPRRLAACRFAAGPAGVQCPDCRLPFRRRVRPWCSAPAAAADNGRMNERARHWQYDELPGVDLLRARYVHKTFVRHTHENFVIAAIADGVEVFHHGGGDQYAGAGALALVNPDTPHTGAGRGARGVAVRGRVPAARRGGGDRGRDDGPAGDAGVRQPGRGRSLRREPGAPGAARR
ncbi:hypothetical protein GCM10010309_75280 [Streptomyces violaceochromogenes]|nr:hypothetical protein GCM10010309_75280 [Streptomyces violaceochromogenes]